MAYTIPLPIVNYNLPATVLPSLVFEQPREGRRIVPIELTWAGNGETYQINVQGIATQPFSQIVMLDVDNSTSGADVTFYFPDTQDILVVPAGSGGLFPVFTMQVQVYASAPQALLGDVTRFRVLNYRQEPVALPPPQFSQIATALGIAGPGTTPIVAAGISGTLTSYSVNVGLQANGAGFSNLTAALVDHGTGAVIDQASVTVETARAFSGTILFASGIAVRFADGLDIVVANAGLAFVTQVTNAAIRYHTP